MSDENTNLPTFSYSKNLGNGWTRELKMTPTNLADFETHDLDGLPGVIVGTRVVKDGKTIVPPEGEGL